MEDEFESKIFELDDNIEVSPISSDMATSRPSSFDFFRRFTSSVGKLFRPRSWDSDDLSSKDGKGSNDTGGDEPSSSSTSSNKTKKKKIIRKTISLVVDSDDSIESVMERIYAMEGIPCNKQQLKYENQPLDSNLTISDYRIEKGSVIQLRLKQ